jgi:hypothetical protein
MERQPGLVAASRQTTGAVLLALPLLGLVGCGDVGSAIVGPEYDYRPPPRTAPIRPVSADAVEVKRASLRSTPGGCEIDVTFTNVTQKTIMAGFTYRLFDGQGLDLGSRSTAVQTAGPWETRTVSSEGTTAGPSGIPCSRIARFQLEDAGGLAES